MSLRKRLALPLLCLVWLPVVPAAGQRPEGHVTIVPQPCADILANPGMGWETFDCTRKQDKNLPAWIPSTVQYVRWGWRELEAEPGKLNTALLDGALKESRQAGQRLALRVMVCSPTPGQPYHPAWIRDIAGGELTCDCEGGPPVPIPDLDNPQILNRHLDFIQRLGRRYDGHPDLDHVDLGSIGWWGEWHLSGSRGCRLPRLENRMKVVDAYLPAFKKTPLADAHRWRPVLDLCHAARDRLAGGLPGRPGRILKNLVPHAAGIPRLDSGSRPATTFGRPAPVAWETCWDMRKWVQRGLVAALHLQLCPGLHASYINNKSAPLPQGPEVRPELERFLRRLGYRLVLKQLRHPASVKAGEPCACR